MARWPIIRHARYFYHVWRFNRWMRIWGPMGYFANQSDIDHLDAIWKGEQ